MRRAAKVSETYGKAITLRFWIILILFYIWGNTFGLTVGHPVIVASEEMRAMHALVFSAGPTLLVVYTLVSWVHSPLKKQIRETIEAKTPFPWRNTMTGNTRFEDALIMAAHLHADQKRKGTDIPYISHLMSVSAIVLEYGGTEDEAIAGLLHDAVEDQGGPPVLDEIRERFGDHVASIVDACSDTDVYPKPPWHQRKEDYIAAIAHKEPSALLVSMADKLHNIRCILSDYRQLGDELWSRFSAGRDDQLWYYRSLADAFLKYGHGPLATEVDRCVTELEQLCKAE